MNEFKATRYLCQDISVADAILEMAHQHEIAGLEPVVKDGVVVDVAQHGPSAVAVAGLCGVQRLAQPADKPADVRLFSLIDSNDIRLHVSTTWHTVPCP